MSFLNSKHSNSVLRELPKMAVYCIAEVCTCGMPTLARHSSDGMEVSRVFRTLILG